MNEEITGENQDVPTSGCNLQTHKLPAVIKNDKNINISNLKHLFLLKISKYLTLIFYFQLIN